MWKNGNARKKEKRKPNDRNDLMRFFNIVIAFLLLQFHGQKKVAKRAIILIFPHSSEVKFNLIWPKRRLL